MVPAESNTATGLLVVSASTLHQVKRHFNEGRGTSERLSAVQPSAGGAINSCLGQPRPPASLAIVDRVTSGIQTFQVGADVCCG